MGVNGNLTFGQVWQQSWDFLRALSPRQRLWLAGGAVAVAATLFVFVQLIGKPEYKTLYSGLNPKDSQALGAQLKAKNIPFLISPDGASLQVPADKLDAARLEVASQPLPNSGRLGFELFDKPNWAGSDFSEKVNYQRALEAELERTLQNLSEVESVRVHLVMPSESIYTERERTAKASVMVKLRQGRLPEKSDTAIRQLVAGAVDRLSPENVVVVDAETNLPLGRPGARNGADGDTEFDQELVKRVVAELEPVVGAEGVRASVHVEYDLSSGEETQETYDPNSSVALSMTRSEERIGTGALGGVPGTSSNLPNAKVAVSPKAESDGHTHPHRKRHLCGEPGGAAHDPAARPNQAHCRRLAGGRCGGHPGEERPAHGGAPPTHGGRDEAHRGTGAGGAGHRSPLAATCWRWRTFRSRECPRSRRRRRPGWNGGSAACATYIWLFRYAALACLFASVYLLLLRPVKRQILTALRALPKRTASKTGGAAELSRGEAAGRCGFAGRHLRRVGPGRRSLHQEAIGAQEPPGGQNQDGASRGHPPDSKLAA